MLIDSHAHLTGEGIESAPLLERAQRAGVTRIINICTNPDELERGLALARLYPWVSNSAATTPHDVESEGEKYFDAIAAQVKQLVALGETGLDYHHVEASRALQRHFLCRYLALAREAGLPVIIHCRDAFADLFQILDACYEGPGVVHCFTGSLEEAKGVIARGWHLSLSGIVTFKKSGALHEVARWVPLERLLLETDTPYLAPVPYRGKPNEPAFLVETARCVAQLRALSYEELAQRTSQNALDLFRLSL